MKVLWWAVLFMATLLIIALIEALNNPELITSFCSEYNYDTVSKI